MGSPPLIEMVMAITFAPINGLTTPYLGQWWLEIENDFPLVQEQPPFRPIVEQFDRSSLFTPQPMSEILSPMGFQKIVGFIGGVPQPDWPANRCWFLNKEQDLLLQVQRDVFSIGWRKLASKETYPGYSELAQHFENYYNKFTSFLQSKGLGPLNPIQCDLTYINHIGMDQPDSEKIWRTFSACNPNPRNQSFLKAETAFFQFSYLFSNESGETVGRLHAWTHPFMSTEIKPGIRLNLSARGKPSSQNVKSILEFFSKGHLAVHKGLETIVSEETQKIWGMEG